jgi:rod shape determining protein RodA
MLYCAGVSGWYFLGAFVLIAVSLPFLWELLKPYQQQRIIYGFSPEGGPTDIVRQPLMSLEAISRGGMFGRGLFSGGVYEDLAASHTDFIFATVCEKFGFVGGFAVVACLVVLVLRVLWLAIKCRDTVGKLICAGIAAVIILQTVENLWMCIARVPVVGITLPFMSAGGSSVLALYIMIGLAHSVAAKEKKYYFVSGTVS